MQQLQIFWIINQKNCEQTIDETDIMKEDWQNNRMTVIDYCKLFINRSVALIMLWLCCELDLIRTGTKQDLLSNC